MNGQMWGADCPELLQHFSGKTGTADFLTQGGHFIPASGFYGTLAFVVYQQGALLGLLRTMTADCLQDVNHIIKGIHIIIENHQAVGIERDGFDLFE